MHDEVIISHFESYLSQMLMDFASIWVILKVPITILRSTDHDFKVGQDLKVD